MSLLNNKFPILAEIDDSTPAGGGSKTLGSNMNHEDVIEFLGEEDEPEKIDLEEKKESTKEKKIPEKKSASKQLDDDDEIHAEEGDDDEEETVDELAELEEEITEPSEEQLELVTPVRRRDILKKYPSLFKEFPYLEKAYYREQQFTELLPTINDAKVAVEKSKILDNFENDVVSGNTETILKAVKETNPNGFLKIVDNYLPTLARVDQNAYFHVVGNVAKHTIVAMAQEAKRTNNEQLQQAAHLLNQFVFGTSDFVPPTNLAKEERQEDRTKERQLTEREQGFVRQQFDSARTDLNSRVNNTLRNTIEAHIDPRSSMSDYVKKNASRDAIDTLDNLINQDARFKNLVDRLWEKAFEENFTKVSVDRIRSAYVSKAKTLLPSVIKKARNDALRGTGRRVDNDSDSAKKKGPVPPGRPRSQESKSSTGKKDVPKGMSTLEFLNSD